MNERNDIREILIFILISTGMFLLFSIGFRWVSSDYDKLTGIIRIISAPGDFLFSAFLWVSFLVPLYLFAYALILSSPSRGLKELLLLNASLVPFLTLGILVKLMFATESEGSAITLYLIFHFGKIPSSVVVLLVFLIELVFMYRLAVEYEPGKADGKEGEERNFSDEFFDNDTETEEKGVETDSVDRELILLEDKRDDGKDWQEKRQDEREGQTVREEIAAEGVMENTSSDITPDSRREIVSSTLPYKLPVHNVLKDYPDGRYWEIDEETERAAEILMQTLEEFKIKAELTGIRKGPVITMFEILPAPGVKISKIVNLADNIALRLAALRVRIVAPIPGRHAVGIEIPNKKRNVVSFKEIITLKAFEESSLEIPIVLGKDITGESRIVDLVQTPHLLIAGATGSGKSVCVNSIINSILFKKSPEQVRMILIDPKIVELKVYNDIPHLLTPVITDPKKAFQALQYCLDEMERRYSLLDSLGVRDIHSYNSKVSEEKLTVKPLPYIVIIVDEFADLMATSGREMEATLARLAAMSRAVGIHLVLATQRPSIDVITGLIKANIPSRIAFMVASKFDSRIIIDTVGAEKLLGKGDMLFTAAWDPVPVRIQGAFLSEAEVEAITDHLRSLGKPEYIDDEIFFDEDGEELFEEAVDDPLIDKAMEIIFAAGKASASYLQRRLKIGYNRAARIIEELERRGIVGPQNGSKPREIIKAP